MKPDANPTRGQDPASIVSQSRESDGISPLGRWYTDLRMEVGGAGGPATGVPPAPGDQGDGGTGGTPGGGGGGFNWDMFPDVPEEHKALLEPHLKNTQGHVTKLEQQFAPFKGLAESGLDAETVQGIVALNQSFDKDPMGTWVSMGQEMQQRGLLPKTLDMQAVSDILAGKDAEEPAGGGAGNGDEEVPAYAKQLQERLDQRDAQDRQREQEQAAQAQEQQLEQAVQSMTTQLKEAGLSDAEISKVNLIGPIIAHKGDPDAALQEVVGFWEAARAGLTDKRTEPGAGGDGVTLTDKGAPPIPDTGLRGRGSSKGFAEANKSAKQFLDRQRSAEAQGS